jgi:hypothetical protein
MVLASDDFALAKWSFFKLKMVNLRFVELSLAWMYVNDVHVALFSPDIAPIKAVLHVHLWY